MIKYGLNFTLQAIVKGENFIPSWLLSDSCSAISSVRNQDLLKSVKICTPEEKLCVYISCGYLDYDQIGTLKYLSLDVINN